MPGNTTVRQLLGLYAAHGAATKGRVDGAISLPALSRATGLPESRLNALRGTFRADRATRALKPEEARAIAAETVRLELLRVDVEALAAALLGEIGEEDAGPIEAAIAASLAAVQGPSAAAEHIREIERAAEALGWRCQVDRDGAGAPRGLVAGPADYLARVRSELEG